MYKFNDLAGKKFGRLTVLEQVGRTSDRRIKWKCMCECGNECYVVGRNLSTAREER